ncbi:MAG: 3-isopropylmalate dehydratase large subunit [bacterium]|jgi:3-isopropylmalate/(R)-2-methylmalate dehydratase large subunit
MGMTIAEKILAAHANKHKVQPGELIQTRLDVILANDITGPPAIAQFNRIGLKQLPYPEKVVLIPDHFTPNKDIASAENSRILREFAQEQKLPHYYEVGRNGIEHVFLPEQGLVLPGDVVIGADSHTCTYGALGAFATGVGSTDLAAAMATGETWFKVPPTLKFNFHGQLQPHVGGKDLILHIIGSIGVDGARYKAMEFAGPVIEGLSMADRFTIANMAVEAGGKAGLIAPDATTLSYCKERANRPYQVFNPDPDAVYEKEYEYDVSTLEPQVAFPYSPGNTRPVSAAAGIPVDQVVIGSCTNGRLEDLEAAAAILAGREVHPRVRLIVVPGSRTVFQQALKKGIIDTFITAGAVVSPPTCGPCMGGHMGVLAAEETCLSTTNRNFVGRMGHPKSRLFLAGPPVAAASAIAGMIVHPREVVSNGN